MEKIFGLLIAVVFGIVIGIMVSNPINPKVAHTYKICTKPSEDSGLANCGLDYHNGAWYVTVNER